MLVADIKLSPEERVAIAKDVLELIKNDYEIKPKAVEKAGWVGLKDFTKMLPVLKSKEWVRNFILTLPEFEKWAVNVNPGKGRATMVDADHGVEWVEQHVDEIDWKEKLP